jgi:uncharacterized protein DUF6082
MADRPTPRGIRIPAHRVLFIALVMLLVAISLGGVAFSPLALNGVGGLAKDWDRLSLIGQTYGAASALLSVLALIGIAVSLLYQAREHKANREQALRSSHMDLMQKAMEDPLYARVWGPLMAPGDFDSQREHLYVNLIISHWEMEFGLGALSEAHLRAIANAVFLGEAGQRYWEASRPVRMISSMGRRERRFHQILDEEFRKASEQVSETQQESELPHPRPPEP